MNTIHYDPKTQVFHIKLTKELIEDMRGVHGLDPWDELGRVMSSELYKKYIEITNNNKENTNGLSKNNDQGSRE